MSAGVTDLGFATNAGGPVASYSKICTVPAGALIVVAVVDNQNSPSGSVSDARGNSYSAISNASFLGVRLYYSANVLPLTAQAITYTVIGAFDGSAMALMYATGIVPTTPLDSAATATNFTAATTSASITSGTPTKAGELFVAFFADVSAAGSGTSNTAGWSTPFSPSGLGLSSVAEIIIGGNQVNGGISPLTYAPNAWTNAVDVYGIIAAFQVVPDVSFPVTTFPTRRLSNTVMAY